MRFSIALPLALATAVFAATPVKAGSSLLDYVGECVPFARAASGIQIWGDAWTWWDQAKGRYARGNTPRVGAVFAFAKSNKLPLGHVAVVS
ncbi:MAG: CHAP domain-containing protein, partial [Massilia sp.]